jgi:hypothetical protein
MENYHSLRIITLQGSTIPSTPLDVVVMGSADLLLLLSHLNHACRYFNDFICHLQHLEMLTRYSLPSATNYIHS